MLNLGDVIASSFLIELICIWVESDCYTVERRIWDIFVSQFQTFQISDSWDLPFGYFVVSISDRKKCV